MTNLGREVQDTPELLKELKVPRFIWNILPRYCRIKHDAVNLPHFWNSQEKQLEDWDKAFPNHHVPPFPLANQPRLPRKPMATMTASRPAPRPLPTPTPIPPPAHISAPVPSTPPAQAQRGISTPPAPPRGSTPEPAQLRVSTPPAPPRGSTLEPAQLRVSTPPAPPRGPTPEPAPLRVSTPPPAPTKPTRPTISYIRPTQQAPIRPQVTAVPLAQTKPTPQAPIRPQVAAPPAQTKPTIHAPIRPPVAAPLTQSKPSAAPQSRYVEFDSDDDASGSLYEGSPPRVNKGKEKAVSPHPDTQVEKKRAPPTSSGKLREAPCKRCAGRRACLEQVGGSACVYCATLKMKCEPHDDTAPRKQKLAKNPAPLLEMSSSPPSNVPSKRPAPGPNPAPPAKRLAKQPPKDSSTDPAPRTASGPGPVPPSDPAPPAERPAPRPTHDNTKKPSKPAPSGSKKRKVVKTPKNVVELSDDESEGDHRPKKKRPKKDFETYYGGCLIFFFE
jgi:hypothetical protein